MDVRVALLRGINVGTAKRVAMADLRQVFEGLGLRGVRTLLNSGNVAFTVAGRAPSDLVVRIEQAIADRLGVTSRVMLLPGAELRQAIRANPLADVAVDPSRLLIMPLRDARTAAEVKVLTRQPWRPEALAVRGRVAYLWCANGIASSPLALATGRVVGERGTARNLRTMLKLVAMVEAAA